MKKIIWLIPCLLFFGCSNSMSSDPRTDVNYVTAEKVITKDCGTIPCNFEVIFDVEGANDKIYKSDAILNPETQTFQAKIFTTSSYTWGFGGGIVYLDDDQHVTINRQGTKDTFTVDNITDANWKEYGSWYRASLVYDLLLVLGVPIGFFIIMAFIIGFGNTLADAAEEGVAFLGTKEGKKLLKKVDKNIRTKY